MAEESGAPSPAVEVLAARRDEEPILAHLLELYIHDFSEFFRIDLQSDGRFGYPNLSSYWTDPDRHPFLIRVNGQLAGFVLIAQIEGESEIEPVWDVAEFFILRGFRRRGLGQMAAHQVWQRYPGRWQVRVLAANGGAAKFWEQAIGEYLGRPGDASVTEIRGTPWQVFSFQSQPGGRSGPLLCY